jgi:hypothetical protein
VGGSINQNVQPFTLPLIATPAIAFPKEEAGSGTTALTNKQKLAEALKACRKKSKSKRAACEKRAHKKYGAKKKHKHLVR